MYLKELSLTNYRNYARLELPLQARVHILQGDNAQGKTNLLEAIYYLATTRTPLTSSEKQLIYWAANAEVIPYAYVRGTFTRGGEDHTIEIRLAQERETERGIETTTLRRQIRLDGIPRRAMDVVGKLNVVLFLPEDVALVAGSPEERRRYLDITLCQIDPAYCRNLSRYNRVLTQRNALLKQIGEGHASPGELGYWDEQLAQVGAYVLVRRLWALGELSRAAKVIHATLTGGQEELVPLYHGSIWEGKGKKRALPESRPELSMGGTVDEALVQADFREALLGVRREEIARGVTVLGPHRDDLNFQANGTDMNTYGSRGQQRTVALALKLAEVELMAHETGEMPVLLLDDVVSELDAHRCEYLLGAVTRAEQVLITTTDLHFYRDDFLALATHYQVVAGSVRVSES